MFFLTNFQGGFSPPVALPRGNSSPQGYDHELVILSTSIFITCCTVLIQLILYEEKLLKEIAKRKIFTSEEPSSDDDAIKEPSSNSMLILY